MKYNQISINIWSNIANLITNVIVGLYYTPYLVHQLGIAAYGVVPLALIINQYIGLVTGSLTTSFSRFYSVYLQQKKYEEASKSISTSLIVVFFIILVIIPLAELFIYNLDSVFNIPVKYVVSAKWLFRFTIFSFCLSLVSSLLNTTLFALNRLDLLNLIKILRGSLKLVFVLCFFNVIGIDIVYVGISNFVSELVIIILSIYFFCKYKPRIVSIDLCKYNKTLLYTILGMAFWVIVHQVGDSLLYRIDNIVVNIFWGIKNSGSLGAVSEFGVYVTQVASVFGSLFAPLIMIAYSKNNHEEVQSLVTGQSYIIGVLASILAGMLAGYAKSLLNIWLGHDFIIYESWMIIKLLVIPFYAAGGILSFVYRAWNKVKIPALTTLLVGIINFILSISVAYIWNSDKSIIVLLIISSILSILQCYILNAYFVVLLYPNTKFKFLLAGIKFGLVFSVSFLISKCGSFLFEADSMLTLLLYFVVVFSLSFTFVYMLGVFKEHMHQLKSLFK